MPGCSRTRRRTPLDLQLMAAESKAVAPESAAAERRERLARVQARAAAAPVQAE
jgi:hypothetical protein